MATTSGDDEEWADTPAGPDAYARIAAERRDLFAQALGDARRLTMGSAIQARCLECAGLGPARPSRADLSLLQLVLTRVGL
jgi:protease IV